MLEGAFEELLTKLQPSQELILTAEKMFRKLWTHRGTMEQARKGALEKECKTIERKIDQMLDRIVEVENVSTISAFERKIKLFEDRKRVIEEKLEGCGRPVKSYDQMYRTAMQFLASPHKIWTYGGFTEKGPS